MAKRYYIEVTDLTDRTDGSEQLRRAGIAQEHILVVDTAEDSLVRAIREVTGVGMDGILSHSRERGMVAARTMYVHYAIIRGDSIDRICATLDRPRNRIRYYLADYEPKAFGDREFKLSTEKVQQLLDADPTWRPARFERQPVKRRRGRKGRRKATKMTIPSPKRREDPRQLNLLDQLFPTR